MFPNVSPFETFIFNFFIVLQSCTVKRFSSNINAVCEFLATDCKVYQKLSLKPRFLKTLNKVQICEWEKNNKCMTMYILLFVCLFVQKRKQHKKFLTHEQSKLVFYQKHTNANSQILKCQNAPKKCEDASTLLWLYMWDEAAGWWCLEESFSVRWSQGSTCPLSTSTHS